MIKGFARWFFHDRRVGFHFGRCSWCNAWGGIVPGEILCEDCWLSTK